MGQCVIRQVFPTCKCLGTQSTRPSICYLQLWTHLLELKAVAGFQWANLGHFLFTESWMEVRHQFKWIDLCPLSLSLNFGQKKVTLSVASVTSMRYRWKSVTFPCMDIIGVLPVLYTHLQLVFEFEFMLLLVFVLEFIFELISVFVFLPPLEYVFVYACVFVSKNPPYWYDVNLLLVFLISVHHHFDSTLIVVFATILKERSSTLEYDLLIHITTLKYRQWICSQI